MIKFPEFTKVADQVIKLIKKKMKKELEQIFNKTKSVHLAEDEKTQMKAGLVSFMASKEILERKKDSGFSLWRVFKLRWSYALGALMLLVFAGGGVSAAASNALPGDTLYPVKINVNEEIRSVLTFSEEAKISWEEERMIRRLEEALKLSIAGRIDAQIGEQIVRNFDRQADRAIAEIKGFESKDLGTVADMISSFEVTLSVHDDILKNLTELDGIVELKGLAVKVREKADNVTRTRMEAQEFLKDNLESLESDDDSQGLEKDGEIQERREKAAKRMRRTSIQRTEELEKMVSRMEENGRVVDEEKISETHRKIKNSKELIENGNSLLEEKRYGEAFFSFQEALVVSQTSSLLLRAEASMSIAKASKELKDLNENDIDERDLLLVTEISEFGEIDLENTEKAKEKIQELIDRELSKIASLLKNPDHTEEIVVETEAGIMVAEELILEALEKIKEEELEEAFALFENSYLILKELEANLKPPIGDQEEKTEEEDQSGSSDDEGKEKEKEEPVEEEKEKADL